MIRVSTHDIVASSPVPFFSRAGRRAARFARGKKEGPGIQRSRMCQNSGNQDTCQDTFVYCWGQTS